MPWADLLYPSINLALNGFTVTADQVVQMNLLGTRGGFLSTDPNWAEDFAPNGTLVGVNDIMTRKRYGALLEQIAEGGVDAFYNGPIASQIVTALQFANGTMTLQDLNDYTVATRDPVEIDYRGFRIISCSAPSSGIVVLSVFKIVQNYLDFGSENMINLDTHRLDEAIRFGYGAVSAS